MKIKERIWESYDHNYPLSHLRLIPNDELQSTLRHFSCR